MLNSTIEIKFNHINDKKYNRLLSSFSNDNQEYVRVAFDNMSNQNTIKKRTLINNNQVNWTTKKTINTINEDLYTINVVEEFPIDQPANFKSLYSREKLQHHFRIDDYDLYLSETIIKDKNAMNNQYEVQLDVKNIGEKTNTLIEQLLSIMNETNVVYTEQERLKLVQDCNKILKNNNKKYIPNVLVKSENINIKNIDDIYMVSTKAKGQRRMLIIHSSGVWLVNPPYDYNLLIRYHHDLNYFINSWHLTIFDGDLIEPIHKTEYDFNYLYWFLCYDCLVFNKKDIRKNNYIDRIDKAKTFSSLITRYIKNDFFKFSLQTTRVIDKEISKAREILSLQEFLNYPHDGLIFTPITFYQNVYQWVPPSSITFDLSIYESGIRDKITLHVYDEELNKDVPIDSIIPFDESMILQESFDHVGHKTIGECKWDNVLSKMVLIKIRNDKSQADSVNMVLDNWKNVNEPLTC